jgi:hypothetical protein
LRSLYRDVNRRLEDSILVAGTARSGTTWLGDLLAGKEGRILFEPFHPGKVAGVKHLSYFPYLRPDEADERLSSFCEQVFRGALRHPWVDREAGQLRPAYRVIKEVRANLFLAWLHRNFPQVPQLLIVRHPCAVVLSRLQLGWATDSDIGAFLEQPALVEDHLQPYLDVIERASTAAEKHAVIWCVSHLIPLRQSAPRGVQVVFYENLCVQPHIELPRIEHAIKRPLPADVAIMLTKPSATSTASSAVLTGDDRVSHWQKGLEPDSIRQVLRIVAAFGLDFLYGDDLLPQVTHLGDTHHDLA